MKSNDPGPVAGGVAALVVIAAVVNGIEKNGKRVWEQMIVPGLEHFAEWLVAAVVAVFKFALWAAFWAALAALGLYLLYLLGLYLVRLVERAIAWKQGVDASLERLQDKVQREERRGSWDSHNIRNLKEQVEALGTRVKALEPVKPVQEKVVAEVLDEEPGEDFMDEPDPDAEYDEEQEGGAGL